MYKIAINGFGRIGRNVLRALYERPDLQNKIQIIAINDLGDASISAHLLKFDTVHGRFGQQVEVGENSISINGQEIKWFCERDPASWLMLQTFERLANKRLPTESAAVLEHFAAAAVGKASIKGKKAAAAAKRALAAEDAAPTAPGGLSEDQLRSALAAFLSGSIPVTTSGTGE